MGSHRRTVRKANYQNRCKATHSSLEGSYKEVSWWINNSSVAARRGGESQANGAIGDTAKTMIGIVQVLNTESILQCIVLWSDMVYNGFKLDQIETSYERQHGRTCKLEMVPLGEFVMCKRLREGLEGRKSL